MMHYQRFVSKEITIFVLFISAHKYPSLYLTIYLSIYISIYLSTYLPIYLSIYRPLCLFYLSIFQLLVVALSTFCNTEKYNQHFVSKKITILPYLSIYLSAYPLSNYMYTSILLSIYLPIYLSIYLSIYPIIHLSTYLYIFCLC